MTYRIGLPLIGLAVLAACSPEPPAVLDLVEALGEAQTRVESQEIDIGTPVGRRHLLEGFLGGDENWANRPDQNFVWATGRDATLAFYVFEPRDLVMTLTGRPNPAESATPMTQLGIEVNGRPIGRPDVELGWHEYRLTVPRQILVPGENRLRLVFGDGEGGESLDRRMAVDRVDFERTIVTYPVRRELGAPALVVPYLSGVWYRPGPLEEARLVVDEVLAYGLQDEDGPGRLEIVVRSSDGEFRHEARTGDSVSLPLPPGMIDIALLGRPAGDPNARLERRQNEEAVGLLLRRPRIVGRSVTGPDDPETGGSEAE